MMGDLPRRTFLGIAGAALPFAALGQVSPLTVTPPLTPKAKAVRVPVGEDRFGEHKTLGPITIDFKVSGEDSGGGVLVIENTNRAKGGPARHLHFEQDELFYVLEGEYVIEVGSERFSLRPGDSLLAPRRVPHVWARVGDGLGRLLITFTPADRMEAFFREVSKANAMPPQDPAIWLAHGMELLGPPLPVE